MTQEKVINPFRNFQFHFNTEETDTPTSTYHRIYLEVTHPDFPDFRFITESQMTDKALRTSPELTGNVIANIFSRALSDLSMLLLHGESLSTIGDVYKIKEGTGIKNAGIAYNKEKQLWYSTKTIYEKN